MSVEYLFDENGLLEPNRAGQIENAESSHVGGPFPMSSYFEIPIDVINRMVKNPMEVSVLKRMGEISRELDKIISTVLSATAVEPLDSVSASQMEMSAEISQEIPKHASHQPLEESTLFAESSASSGRMIAMDPNSLPESDTIIELSLEEKVKDSVSAMAKGINEMIGFMAQIRLFQVGNQYVAEELAAAHCHELAEQKRLIAESEKFIVEHLERVQNGQSLLPRPAPWIAFSGL
jgi:hypothetical protein